MKEYLTVNYGREGIGWAAEPGRYLAELEVAPTAADPYRTVPSEMIDIVVYPDGDIYHQHKYK